jgi:hypothetical protein
VPRQKPKLSAPAQKRLVQWIEDALGPVNRAEFVRHFKIDGFKQTTFNRDIGPSGTFTEQRAREVCRALKRSFDDLSDPLRPHVAEPDCGPRCGLFHAINASTCPDPNEIEVRKRTTWKLVGHYKIVYRFVVGTDAAYEVAFTQCTCGAVLFEYVKDDDPLPLCSEGFALCVGEMLSIFMIGDGLHWTLACHVPRQVHKRPLTGIILDPNAQRSQVEANKFVLIKLGTPIAGLLTDSMIAGLLNNKPGAANGSLVSTRE